MGLFKKGIFIFRRDLRLEDNTALHSAARQCGGLLPVFIFDPRQSKPEENPYFGAHAFDFLLNALASLSAAISARGGRLLLLEGKPEGIIGRVIKAAGAEAVFVNADYTPFSKKRDAALQKACSASGAEFVSLDDLTLYKPGSVLTKESRPYTVFTAFRRKCSETPPPFPLPAPKINFFHPVSKGLPVLSAIPAPSAIRDTGGEAQAILAAMSSFGNYRETRNFPALAGTTGLSPHLKAGTLSPRQAWHACAAALGTDHPLLNELCWRDFFIHIAFSFPQVFGSPFREKFGGLRWENNPRLLKAWRTGMTGFPIVDAGMRELNATGFMHNRVRMIAASFLVKDLLVDWRIGERYFASKLADYDPAVNNGNWQWCAGTGCDAQPFFRVFNPWLQARRYDAGCAYIKHWVPELKGLTPREILTPGDIPSGLYPRPLVEHGRAARRTLLAYRTAAR